jgi:hypothetical protein
MPFPAGGQLGQADEHVEAEVFPEQGFEVAALDDLDPAAVAGGEVPAGLAHHHPCKQAEG